MSRSLPYIALFLTAVLSQLFIFDQLSVSVYLAPLVYILFIALLPIETSQIKMLGAGILLGMVMDATMGTQGLSSIATIFVAFFRQHIIRSVLGNERAVERGVPSEVNFGFGDFFRYVILVVAVHHFVFFFFEVLSMAQFGYMLVRFGCSAVISIIYVWLVSRFFSINKFLK